MSGRFGHPPRLARFALVLQSLAAVAFVAVLLHAEGVALPFTGGGDWTLTATFTDAGGIRDGESTPVLVSGVPEGTVTGVAVRNGQAQLTMRIDAAMRGVIRRGASARIEPRSALEDMTVDITPGTGAAAPSGMAIAADRTQPTVTLDRVTAILDADTRTQLAIVLDQLAAGLHGRGGQLAADVIALRDAIDPATRVTGALAQRRVLISGLVGAVARISVAAQSSDRELGGALRSAQVVLGTLARNQGAVAQSVTQLPATLAQVSTALDGVRNLAGPLVPTLARLQPVAHALPGALRTTRRVTGPATALLAAAGRLSTRGATGLAGAGTALSQLRPASAALTPALNELGPIVSAVNQRRDGIGQLGERFSGVLSTNDANGTVLRGLGDFEPFNPADFGQPGASGAARTALAAQAATALTLACRDGQAVACLVRYLVPGLPGSVRSAGARP